jgi:hypothetical protein
MVRTQEQTMQPIFAYNFCRSVFLWQVQSRNQQMGKHRKCLMQFTHSSLTTRDGEHSSKVWDQMKTTLLQPESTSLTLQTQ